MQSFKNINLANNQLLIIPAPQYLGIVIYLDYLDIRNNHVKETSDVIPYLNVSDQLLLGGNPLSCDCAFMQLQLWYQNEPQNGQQVSSPDTGCFSNGTFISISDNFPVQCKFDNTSYSLRHTDSSGEKKDPVLSAETTPWTTKWSLPLTSTLSSAKKTGSKSTLLPDRGPCNTHKKERQLTLKLTYCVVVIVTLLFISWIVKNLIIVFRRFQRNSRAQR